MKVVVNNLLAGRQVRATRTKKKKGVVAVKNITPGAVQPSTGKSAMALDGAKLNLDDGTDAIPKEKQKQAQLTDMFYNKPATQPTEQA